MRAAGSWRLTAVGGLTTRGSSQVWCRHPPPATRRYGACRSVRRRLISFTQAGGEVNVAVAGINVGAQPYSNAEAIMLLQTKGILVMTPESAIAEPVEVDQDHGVLERWAGMADADTPVVIDAHHGGYLFSESSSG